MSISSLARLDIARGTRNFGVGGGIIGALVGGSIAAMSSTSDENDEDSGFSARWLVIGTAIGAGVGSIAGSYLKTTRWEPAPIAVSLELHHVSGNTLCVTVDLKALVSLLRE